MQTTTNIPIYVDLTSKQPILVGAQLYKGNSMAACIFFPFSPWTILRRMESNAWV